MNKFEKAVKAREEKNIKQNDNEQKGLNESDNEQKGLNESDNSSKKDEMKLDGILNIDKKKYNNKTFYLEEKVLSQLSKVAKRNKVSESKLANHILKEFLNID